MPSHSAPSHLHCQISPNGSFPLSCEHADISSILQKTTFDSISPSSCPLSQLAFAAKSSKVFPVTFSLLFFLPFPDKPTHPWKSLTSKPPVTSMMLILGIGSWSLLSWASQLHSVHLLILLETCPLRGFQGSALSRLTAAHLFY